jgi:hypothetical protein
MSTNPVIKSPSRRLSPRWLEAFDEPSALPSSVLDTDWTDTITSRAERVPANPFFEMTLSWVGKDDMVETPCEAESYRGCSWDVSARPYPKGAWNGTENSLRRTGRIYPGCFEVKPDVQSIPSDKVQRKQQREVQVESSTENNKHNERRAIE